MKYLWILLFLIPHVAAAPQVIFNQTYTAPTTVTLTEDVFDLLVSEGNTTSIQLTGSDNSSVIMDEGDCETFSHEKLCYINKTAEDKAALVLYDLRALFNFSLYLGFSGDLKLGRDVTAVIWMNNTGMSVAEDVDMTVSIPDGIEILDMKFCSHNDTHVWWRSDIDEDRNFDCNFTYRASKSIEATFNATLEYTTYGEIRRNSTTATFQTYLPFPINLTYDNLSEVEPNEEFSLFINITNNLTVNLSIDDLLFGDDNTITYSSSSSSKLSIKGYGASGSTVIIPNESFTVEVAGYIPYIDTAGSIPVTIEYNDSNGTATFTQYIPYKTVSKDLIVFFSTSNNPLESLTTGTVTVSVQNPYSELVFKGYDVEVTGELIDTVYQKTPYAPSRELTSFDVTAPKTNTAYIEEIHASVIATTLKNQKIEASQTLRLKIIPIQFIVLDKQVATATAEGGSAIVTLSAQNTHQENVTISFVEHSPSEAFVQGTTTATVTLAPNETKIIYQYTIIAPEIDASVDELNFTTTYSYKLHSSTITQDEITRIPASLLVPPEPVVNQTSVVQNTTKNETTVQVVEKDGSFDLFYVLVIIIILLVLAFMRFKTPLKRLYYFTFHHKLMLRKHGSLAQEKSLLHKRLRSVDRQKIRITHEIEVLESYLKKYEKEMPKELDKLSLQKNDLLTKNNKLKKEISGFEEKISDLQKDVKKLEDQRHDINQKLDANQKNHDQLVNDDETLKKDIEELKSQYAKAEKIEHLAKSESEKLDKSISQFTNRHTHHFFKQLSTIAEEREHLGLDSKKLSVEEHTIKEELDHVSKDLKISQEDLKDMEKLFKQGSSAQRGGKKKHK